MADTKSYKDAEQVLLAAQTRSDEAQAVLEQVTEDLLTAQRLFADAKAKLIDDVLKETP